MLSQKKLLAQEKIIKRSEPLRLFLILLFIATLIFYGIVFFIWRYGALLNPEQAAGFGNTAFYSISDRWADFFKPIQYTENLNPFVNKWANAPPFMHFVAYLLSLPMKAGVPGNTVYLMYTVAALLIIVGVLFSFTREKLLLTERIFLCVLIVCSYPFVYCMDRGNFVLLTTAFVALFIWTHAQGKLYLAALFLGIAAALKLYPALLAIVFLNKKGIKPLLLCIAVSAGLTLFPLFIYEGSFLTNLSLFLERTKAYSTWANERLDVVQANSSFSMLYLLPKELGPNPIVDVFALLSTLRPYKIASSIGLVAVIGLALLLKRKHDRFLFLICMCLGYPLSSLEYNLVMLAPPLIYWLVRERKKIGTMLIACLGAVLFSCVGVIEISRLVDVGGGITPITLHSLLFPVVLLAIMVTIIVMRRKELRNTLQTTCRCIKTRLRGQRAGT